MSRVRDSHQYLEKDMKDVVTEVESQFMKNNERNDKQENILMELGEAVMGLRGEWKKVG